MDTNMKRRQFLKRTLGVGLSASVPALLSGCEQTQPAQKLRKPNLVYIMVDEMPQRAWSLGLSEQVHTPNLERLARGGMTFANCVSNNPICVPHRAIQLTGMMSHQNGMLWNASRCANTGNYGLHPSNPSWARQLKKAGYKTGYVGKWHLYNQEKGTFTGLDGKPMQAEQVPPGSARFGFDDLWAERYYIDRKKRIKGYFDEKGRLVHWGDYPPAGMFNTMFDFIDANSDEPFAVMCCPNKPHPPFSVPAPPKKWLDYYKDKLGSKGENVELRPNVPENDRTDKLKQNHLYFYAHISAIDELVGQLMTRLETLGIAENTIVIFTSDHGELLLSHGQMHKRWPWDESVLVPFIINWPAAVPKGRTSKEVFSSVDIAPTLLGLCGVQPDRQMQGIDFTNHIKGKSPATRKYAPIMYIRPPEGNYMTEKVPELADYRGVRTPRYTYTKRRDPAGQTGGKVTAWQLFDNEKDPYQLNNLINDPAYSDVQEQLDAWTDQWLAEAGENFA